VDLYSASSRLLLRGAPDSGTAKQSSFKAGVEFSRSSSMLVIYADWQTVANGDWATLFAHCTNALSDKINCEMPTRTNTRFQVLGYEQELRLTALY